MYVENFMRKVLEKLKSNNGATLIMALLFFIVCSVTWSMILLSASSASGRLKGMNKQDQNYYAVSSAVKFIEKTLLDNEVTAKEILVTDIETETITLENGEEEENEIITYDYTPPQLYISESTELNSGLLFDLLTNEGVTNYNEKCSANDERDPEDYPSEFNDKWFKDESSNSNKDSLEDITENVQETILTVNSGSDEIEALKVDVSMSLDNTGLLIIKCKNHVEDDSNEDDSSNTYSVLVKMECKKDIEVEENGSDDHRVKTKEYSFKFDTTSIEKVKKLD